MKKKSILLLMPFIMLITFESNGQLSNYIFAINNASTGVFLFSKIEIATGIITNYQLVGTFLSNGYSSCIDNQAQKYYFCTGTELMTIDPLNGNIVSNVTLPISMTATFNNIAYNPCDSDIYGIISDNGAASFAKYNIGTAMMTTISSLGTFSGFVGGLSFIDPVTEIYSYEDAFINGVSLTTGQILYNSLIIDLPNESFGHIALKCSTHEIFGTSADVNAGIKYLSTVDPLTGIVTHVSNTGWNTGIWKPAGGGARIDQLTGIFYYSAAGALIVGANTVNGNMVYNQPISSGDLYFIEHFSECNCDNTGIKTPISSQSFTIQPNPFNDKLNINADYLEEFSQIILYDIASRKILEQQFTNSVTLNTSQFAKGIYIYEIRNKNGVVEKGKVVKD
jgi:hypothetical protein